MPYHTPEAKAESAFKQMFDAYADTDLQGVQILQRFSVDDITTPSIGIIASKCAPADDGEGPSGNWYVTVECVLRTHYKDNTVAQHDGWLAVVTDLICDQSLCDTLNEIMADEEFNAMQWTIGERNHVNNGELFESRIEGILYMMPSKVA